MMSLWFGINWYAPDEITPEMLGAWSGQWVSSGDVFNGFDSRTLSERLGNGCSSDELFRPVRPKNMDPDCVVVASDMTDELFAIGQWAYQQRGYINEWTGEGENWDMGDVTTDSDVYEQWKWMGGKHFIQSKPVPNRLVESAEPLYYVQCASSFTDAFWHCRTSGYTNDIDSANTYTADEVRSMPAVCRPWPVAYVNGRISRHVIAENLDRDDVDMEWVDGEWNVPRGT